MTNRDHNARVRPALSGSQERLQAAAIEYVMHGWGVILASACDGLNYTRGHTPEEVDDLAPVLPSARTVRDVRAASSWWALAPYGILARTGEAFDVIEAPTWLAVLATGRTDFRRRLCPVLIGPSGVRLLVEPGAALDACLGGERGVCVTGPGALVPLPPTRMMHGNVTWWITPEQVQWRLGDADVVQEALLAVLAEATSSGHEGSGGEARV